jgi:hypothetical protein
MPLTIRKAGDTPDQFAYWQRFGLRTPRGASIRKLSATIDAC